MWCVLWVCTDAWWHVSIITASHGVFPLLSKSSLLHLFIPSALSSRRSLYSLHSFASVCVYTSCSVMSYSLRPPWTVCNPPGSSVHGILQAEIVEWVVISFSGDLPDPGIKRGSPALQADSFTIWATREALVLPLTVYKWKIPTETWRDQGLQVTQGLLLVGPHPLTCLTFSLVWWHSLAGMPSPMNMCCFAVRERLKAFWGLTAGLWTHIHNGVQASSTALAFLSSVCLSTIGC